MEDKPITEKESLDLIATMINKAKNAYHDTGMSAMLWGSVIAFCSLVKFLEIQFEFRLPFDIYWLAVVAIIPQILINKKEKKDRKLKAYDEVYMDYIWLAFGICIFLLILIINVMGYQWRNLLEVWPGIQSDPNSFRLYEYVAPLFLMLYGMPTFITGAACKFKPMLWGGLLCWACCIAAVFTSIRIDLLLTCISAVFAWLIPGIIMEKDYRMANKALNTTHV